MAYIPKKISKSEQVELTKQEVLRYTRMGLKPRHIATQLEIPVHQVYNYKVMLQKDGYDVSPKLDTELTRADKIVKTKVLKSYATIEPEKPNEAEVTKEPNKVTVPLLETEKNNLNIQVCEDGLIITW